VYIFRDVDKRWRY